MGCKKIWNKDLCKEEALKYNKRSDFSKYSNGAYKMAWKEGWLNDICTHMDITKELCTIEALKYSTKKQFRLLSPKFYFKAKNNNWFKDVCKHMDKGNFLKRYVYAFEFDNNCVYIGLTWNIKWRELTHLNNEKSSVYKYLRETGATYILKNLTINPVDKEEAIIQELFYINNYKNNGWTILNKSKGGELGGNSSMQWTPEKIKEVALRYKNRGAFRKHQGSAATAAIRLGIYEDVCSHMLHLNKPKGYWTYERCREVALMCNNKEEFRTTSPSAYTHTFKNNWNKELTAHMITTNRQNGYWSKTRCINTMKKFNNENEFKNKEFNCFNTMKSNGWLSEFYKYIEEKDRISN